MGANTRRGGTVEARQLPPRGRAHYLAIYGRQRPAETLVRTAVSARFMVRMGSRFDSGGGLNPKPAAQAGVTPGLMCAWRAPNRRLPEICQKARSVVVRTHGVTAELGELPRSPRPCGPRLTTGPGSPRRAEWPPPGWCTASLASARYGAPCLEIGRQVRYRQAAVERWLTGSIQAGSPEENR
jgi:hypothetical protein